MSAEASEMVSDVLIIGGGLAGWRAAEAAVARGCSVTLVANGPGNSPDVHALNCPVRDDDSVERYIADTMSSGKGANDPELVRVMCERSLSLKDEFEFDRVDAPTRSGGAHAAPTNASSRSGGALAAPTNASSRSGGAFAAPTNASSRSGGALAAPPESPYLVLKPLGSTVPRCVSIRHAIGAIALARIKARLEDKVVFLNGSVIQVEPVAATPSSPSKPVVAATPSSPPKHVVVVATPSSPSKSIVAATPTPPPFTPKCSFPGRDHYFRSFVDHYQNRLPHWQLDNAVYHVVFRLNDSLPVEKLKEWLASRNDLMNVVQLDGGSFDGCDRMELQSDYQEKVEQYLDSGCGECWLRRNELADVVWNVLIHDNGRKYDLHAIGMMPNHVHVVFSLFPGVLMGDVLQQWKGVSSHKLNRILNRKGPVWEKDYYNHIIRDEGEYRTLLAYVGVKNAGVRGWRWTDGIEGGDGAAATVHEARALILATGGWCGKYDFSTNPKYLKGDGIEFARRLGGAIRDFDEEHVQYEPTVRVDGPRRGIPVITTLLHEGATLRNAGGEEFLVDKCANKDVIAKAIFRELNEGRGVSSIGVWYDLSGCSEASLRRCKMDPGERMILVAPAPHSSLGGVVIDRLCRVCQGEGVVPGLFACGEVTAGVHGLNRLGGNGGTAAMVFGTIAGESAAQYVHECNKGKYEIVR